jgi:CheY-like chemotaxis protein
MAVAYIIISAFAGLTALIGALLLGASFWVAVQLYVLVGTLSVILTAGTRMRNESLSNKTDEENWNRSEVDHLTYEPLDQADLGNEIPMSILAVDDDPVILELIPIISAQVGISNVTTASSGREALDLLSCSETKYDCLMFDISMPEMNGIELCRLVRRMPRYRSTQIIMLTAMRDIRNMGDAYRAGATDYVTKPFDIYNLGTRLRVAQEAIFGMRKSISDDQRNLEDPLNLVFSGISGLLNSENDNIISLTAFSNYLTHLPDKDTGNVFILAVRIDDVESLYSKFSSDHFISLLQDVATAATNCLNASSNVMTFTKEAALLIAVNSSVPISALEIEKAIELQIRDMSPDYARLGVSVGGAVQLRGSRSERARVATDHAITLAKNREFDKQNVTVADFSRR